MREEHMLSVAGPSEGTLELRALSPTFGVEIVGVDLAAPMSDAVFDRIYDAFLEHQLLLFRDQRLEPGDQVTFARRFGSVQVHVMNQYHADGFPEIYYLSNLGPDGKPSGKHPDRGTVHWHTDGSWSRRTGQATLLYAVAVPGAGGETRFASMYDAYEALDDATRERLATLRAVHNLDFSRTRRHGEDLMTEEQKKARPPVDHPIIRIHPETGRRCVFLGDHAWRIDGMAPEESRALIEHLNARIIDPERVYTHRWRPGDLVVWDNRCMLHKAEPYDVAAEARVMRRCTVVGEVPI
jgi:alpha-ketoglutarate-dependent 2,4-dichlorophenoxyacetate dioxygenase